MRYLSTLTVRVNCLKMKESTLYEKPREQILEEDNLNQ